MIIPWLFDSSHLRRVEEPVNKLDLAASAPSPFVYLVMNSYLGRVHCCYPFCVFVTLTKKNLPLNCVPWVPSSQYSQPFLSLLLILLLSQP